MLKCATLPAMSNIEFEWSLPSSVTAVPIPQEPPSFLTVGGRLCLYAILREEKVQVTIMQSAFNVCDNRASRIRKNSFNIHCIYHLHFIYYHLYHPNQNRKLNPGLGYFLYKSFKLSHCKHTCMFYEKIALQDNIK